MEAIYFLLKLINIIKLYYIHSDHSFELTTETNFKSILNSKSCLRKLHLCPFKKANETNQVGSTNKGPPLNVSTLPPRVVASVKVACKDLRLPTYTQLKEMKNQEFIHKLGCVNQG